MNNFFFFSSKIDHDWLYTTKLSIWYLMQLKKYLHLLRDN